MNTRKNVIATAGIFLSLERMPRVKTTLLIVLVLIFSTGCRKETADENALIVSTSETGEKGSEGEEEQNEVTLVPDQIEEAGIEVLKIEWQEVSNVLAAPARIVPTEMAAAEVGSLVAGRVTQLFVLDGSSVRKGAPMAEIESLEIGRLKGNYLRAQAAVEQTRSAFERQQSLFHEEIGAQRMLEEARATFHMTEADFTALSAELAALGIDPKSLGDAEEALSSRIVIYAPISGVVSRREVTLGAFVEPSTDLFEIVNLGAVYADAQVSPDIADKLAAGGTARILTADHQVFNGKIIFIAPSLDPESRTVQTRIRMDHLQQLRPETYVTVEFDTGVAKRALVVPITALEREGNQVFVYRERKPGTYERVAIQLGAETYEHAIVAAGLSAGDDIAVEGVFYLKSAWNKGELGDDD